MSSIVSRIFRFFHYPSAPTRSVVLLGLDAAGKTTLLYQLKPRIGGSVETIIPTIGFNVEVLATSNGELTCWDVGGCDKIRPLWRHYTSKMDALVWIVDSNDRERLPDCKSELDTFLHDCDRPVPILVLANKQDLPNKLSAQEVIDGLCLNEIRLHNWAVFPTCITSGEGIREAFQWLEYQFSSPNDRYQPNPKAVDKTEVVDAKVIATLEENAKEPVAAEANVVHKLGDEVVVTAEVELGSNVQSTSKLFPTVNISPLTAVEVNALKESKGKNMVEDWLSREQVDSDSVVIKKLKSCSLPIWDHYTHVHIAWILLKDHPECLDERFSEIASLLQAFIAKSPLTNGKSFHHTMTYFWCHMIAYTLKQMKRSASTSYDQNNEAPKAFHDFLEASLPIVDLWKGSLFKDYYSGTVIFSASAKTQLLKPDLKPLPW